MKYLKSHFIFESKDDFDKYLPMIKLIGDLLNFYLEKVDRYMLSSQDDVYTEIHDILNAFHALFSKYIKIGDKKYSLSADGDNQLRKLKVLPNFFIDRNFKISTGFDSELYFSDLKYINWLLSKVENDEYHIVTDHNYSSLTRDIIKNSWIKDTIGDKIIQKFKENLLKLEEFYNDYGTELIKPKFSYEDIEDILIDYLDDREIDRPYVYLSNKWIDGFKINYIIEFHINVPYHVSYSDSSDESTEKSRNYSSTIFDKIKKTLSSYFKVVDSGLYVYPIEDDVTVSCRINCFEK